ncbi:MAG: hypothetical protein JWQ40_3944 [Segetibacter sp.]|nr:hypothetical protein [Segetibacter sp.]
MKTAFTLRKWSFMLAFLSSMLLYQTSSAQRPQAKCAGFTAKITNGSILNLCSGASLTLNAEPALSGYNFQWQVQTTAGGPFASIAGATGSTYSTSSLGAYRVYISTGSCIDTSGITTVIRLNVTGGTLTPATTDPICIGAAGGKITGNQVPGADIGIVTYSWEMNDGSGWEPISGASDLNYNVGFLFKTTSYRRVATDNCGNNAYSNVVTLTLAPPLQAGAITPLTQTVLAGVTPTPLTSTAPATGGTNNYTYQWQSAIFDRGPYTNIPGATGLSYSPGPLNQTTYYKRIVKDVKCLNTAESPMATVFVSNGILNAGNFVLYSACFFPGQPSSPLQQLYPPTGGVAPYLIEWQWSSDNVNFTTIPGATGATYQPPLLTESTYFRKKVTDAAGTIVYSASEKITKVETVLTGGSIKATSNVACLGSSPAEITSTGSPTGYAERLSYQWQIKSASGDWKNIDGQIRASLIPDPITEKTWFRRLAMDHCGNNTRAVASNEVEIDTRPALIAGDIEPTVQRIAPGGTPLPLNSVSGPSGGTGSYTLSWESAPLAVGPFSTIPSVNTPGYQPPSLTQPMYYRRVVKDNGCLATKYTYTVEVFLKKDTIIPCTLAGSQCVFPGNRPGVISTTTDPSGGTPPYTYSWETKPILSPTWTEIPGATHMDYQPPVITQTTQYRLKVTDAFGSFAYTAPFTIEVHTEALNPGTIAIESSPILCSGTTAGLIKSVTPVTGYGENPMYQWQMMIIGGSWTDLSGANDESYQPGTITQKTYFRRAVSDMCGGVKRTAYSNEVVFEIPVTMPLRAGLVDGPFITCSGTAPGLIKSVLEACSGSTVSYQWEVLQGGVWQAIAGATSPSYSPEAITANTSYRRKVTDGCGNPGISNTVEIYVYPPITAGVIGNATQTVCANVTPAKIGLLTNCHYTDGAVTYQWQSSNTGSAPWTDISGATGPEYQPLGAATNKYYRLMVKSTTCSFVAYTNVASVIIGNCQAPDAVISGARSAQDMKVYPNPLTGTTVQVKLQTKGAFNVTLLNAQGSPIPVSVSQGASGIMRVSFLKTPSKGMYLLTVNNQNNTWTKKIIVQ